jgi:hypothetical protein
MRVVLPESIKKPGLELINKWKNGHCYRPFGLKESDMVLLLGGSAAWKLAMGLPLEPTDDIDFYFQGRGECRVTVDRLRENIGKVVAEIIGFSRQEILAHKNKYNDEADPSKSYYLLKRNGIDYNIGSREIYSNFQVSIDVESGEVYYDPRISSHEHDFAQFLDFGRIITYHLPTLVLNFQNENNPSLQFKNFSALTFVFKSYLKPLHMGMHFDKKTAKDLMFFKNQTKNAYLISCIAQRMNSFYSLHPEALDHIFSVAAHDLQMGPVLKEMTQVHALKQANSLNAVNLERIEALTQVNTSYQEKIKVTAEDLQHSTEELVTLSEKQKALKSEHKKLTQTHAKKQAEYDALKDSTAKEQTLTQQTIDGQSTQIKELESELLKTKTALHLFHQQFQEICESEYLVIYLRNRLLDLLPSCKSSAQALQSSSDEYNQIKESKDHLESIHLNMAAAVFSTVPGASNQIIGCFEKFLSFKAAVDLTPKQQAMTLLLELDVLFDKMTGFTLSAIHRSEIFINYLRFILMFLKTDFVKAKYSASHANAQSLDSFFASPENLEHLKEVLTIQDRVKAFLDKNHKVLSAFLDQSSSSGSQYPPKLEAVLDEILAMEANLKSEQSDVPGFACEHYLLQHGYTSRQFTEMFNKYRDKKMTRGRVEVVAIWNDLYQKTLVPPAKSSVRVRQTYQSKENSQLFMRMFFAELNRIVPTNNFRFAFRSYLVSLKTYHSTWLTAKQWAKHPLLIHFSMLLDTQAVATLSQPQDFSAYVIKAIAEIQSSTVFPESLFDRTDLQMIRLVLTEILQAFLVMIPKDDPQLLRQYQSLSTYLNTVSAVQNFFSFSQAALANSLPQGPIQEKRLSATLFLNKFLTCFTPFVMSDLDTLGQHLTGFTQETLEEVGILMRRVVAENASKNQTYGRELCSLLSKEDSFLANLGKFMRFFGETEILDKAEIQGREIINELFLTATRLSTEFRNTKSGSSEDHPSTHTAHQGSQGFAHKSN